MDKDSLLALGLAAIQIGLIVLPHPLKPTPKSDSHATQGAHWGYEGTIGPEHWGDISAEYKTCGVGESQTPINITTANVQKASTRDITFAYKASPLAVVNNGHTIQVNYAPGSTATYKGHDYALAQFHFHVPSEHTINGKHWPMNVHLVHKNAQNELLVVEVLFAQGQANPTLATVMDHLPGENEELTLDTIAIDATELLPADIGYYHYDGSLTTPPCTEGVAWFVMKNPIDVAKDDVDAFEAIYPMNARPVQELHDRVVEEH